MVVVNAWFCVLCVVQETQDEQDKAGREEKRKGKWDGMMEWVVVI